MDEIWTVARDVRRRVAQTALGGAGCRRSAEPAALQVCAKPAQDLEVDDELGLPSGASSGGTEEVKVPVVAPQLEEGLIIACFPFRPAPAHPYPKRSVAQQILRPGREAEIGLRPLPQLETPANEAKRFLVDLSAERVLVTAAALDSLEHVRRRLVAEIGPVLGGDDGRD